MTDQPDLESRVTSLEQRMRRVEADAADARNLARDTDRDVSVFALKIDANRQAINALAEQTAGGFREVARQFEGVHRRIDGVEAEMRAGFGEMRAGFTAVGRRLDALIESEEGDA